MSTPAALIHEVAQPLLGMPVYMAGSLVAADEYNLPDAYDDVDIFCPTSEAMVAAVQRLHDLGFQFNDRFQRVWARWLKYGLKGWHTNSMKLELHNEMPTHYLLNGMEASPERFTMLRNEDKLEVNIIYKLQGGHPLNRLSAVLESFDFGLLGVGYDLEHGLLRRDMRSYLFPTYTPDGALPLMPMKRHDWIQGFLSQYNGTREAGRYAKYAKYGYDLHLVRDDLIAGYEAAADYLGDRDQEDKKLLAKIYMRIAELIDTNAIDELYEAGQEILFLDALDEIYEALE